MQCTYLNKLAHMAVVFCRWLRFNVEVRSGIVAIVKHIPTVLC